MDNMSSSRDVLLEEKEETLFHIPEVMKEGKDFDGPLDLLLFLIKKNELNIYDLPISLITQEYLEYLETHKKELENLSDFYLQAAELIYIKTRMLLPVDEELDEDFEDPRSELVDRLIDYQKYKKYAELLSGGDKSGRLYISRPDNLFSIPYEDKELFKGVTLEDLKNTFLLLLSKTPPSKIFNIYKEVTIEQKVALMLELLDEREEITLEDLVVDRSNPLHIICSFMAILESAHKKLVLFRQDGTNMPIYISRRPLDFDEKSADEIDKEADEIISHHLEDPEDFTLLSEEAKINLDKMLHEREENDEEIEYNGDEEEINLDEDEDE